MTCCPHARRKEELLNKYLLNNSVSGFCINGQAYGFCRCTVAKSRTVDSRSKELTEWGPGGHISGASLGSQTDWFCTRREPTEKFPQVQSHSVLTKASPVPAFFFQLLPTQKCIKHSGAPAVTLDVMRTQVFGKHCREASLVWGLAGNTEVEAIPQRSGYVGRSGQHFLVHLPRGAPRKMCPNGAGTFFSFSKRSHVCCHWSCLYARHLLPFPEVSGLHWESRSPTYMIFQFLLFYISPNALLVQPFFSVLFDSCFSFISNVPINAIPN